MKLFRTTGFPSGIVILAALALQAGPGSGPAFAASGTDATRECRIPTARGDRIDPSELGFVIPTQLIIQETPGLSINWPDNTWGADPEKNFADVVARLTAAHDQYGVETIIDRTIPGIGRNVPRMQAIAKQVPVHIIVTTGWYTLYDLPYYFSYREHNPDMFGPEDGPSLEDFMVRDIEEGIMDTGVRAAAIKVVHDKFGLRETPDVRRVFRISANAHKRTGAPILTHSVGTDAAALQLDVLEEDGVDLSRVVLGHLDRARGDAPLDRFTDLLDRGPFLSFDGWGSGEPTPTAPNPSSREKNIERLVELIGLGYIDQLLIAGGPVAFGDSFPRTYREADRYAPYSRLTVDIIPALREAGLTVAQIEQLTVTNPRRVLETLCRGGY